MELRLQLSFEQIMELVRQLPYNQKEQLKKELEAANIPTEKQSLSVFQQFLLSAPTMSEEQHQDFLENRKNFNQWSVKE